MELINLEIFVTKNYTFRKDNIDYNCLVQIKNNQITESFITASNGTEPNPEIIKEIKNLISI